MRFAIILHALKSWQTESKFKVEKLQSCVHLHLRLTFKCNCRERSVFGTRIRGILKSSLRECFFYSLMLINEFLLSLQKCVLNRSVTHLQSFSYCFRCSSRGSFVRMKTGGDQPPLSGSDTSLHSLDGDSGPKCSVTFPRDLGRLTD